MRIKGTKKQIAVFVQQLRSSIAKYYHLLPSVPTLRAFSKKSRRLPRLVGLDLLNLSELQSSDPTNSKYLTLDSHYQYISTPVDTQESKLTGFGFLIQVLELMPLSGFKFLSPKDLH
ncbi:MAG: hypothetical protein ACI85O_000147 [Saprospiraceae bacterium]|jgi:hypothetical protein